MSLRTGDTAPDLTLPDQEGRPVSLDSLLEKGPVALFFYPKDDSPGCTRQVCSFRDNYGALLKHGVSVAGVSRDPQADHVSFIGKHELPYPLLSDTDGEIHKKYGVLGLFGMLSRRITFLIGREKKILLRHEDNFRMNSHVHAVLRALEEGS
jgi:thioredoxin-dependent peroxiredoxin